MSPARIPLSVAPSLGCIICAAQVHEDGSPVTWRCAGCGQRVCRVHALTIPGRVPAEYFPSSVEVILNVRWEGSRIRFTQVLRG